MKYPKIVHDTINEIQQGKITLMEAEDILFECGINLTQAMEQELESAARDWDENGA